MAISKSQLLIKKLLESSTAKKLSAQKLEERENAFISLVQHGELGEIEKKIEENSTLVNRVTRFGKFSAHTPIYIGSGRKYSRP